MKPPANITFEAVTKVFATGARVQTCFADLSLTCEAGAITTIVGASGCGKTTFLNLAAGLIAPDAGTVRFSGTPITGPHPERGVIFQNYALFPWLTVAENVGFGLRIGGKKTQERAASVERLLNLVGLEHVANALPKELSGGMKQRCALARALATAPRALLMDEPFGALDAITRARLQEELLRILDQQPTTILFITHDIDEAVFLSNRVLVMRPYPEQIVMDVEVPYDRNRTSDIRTDREFARIKKELWQAL